MKQIHVLSVAVLLLTILCFSSCEKQTFEQETIDSSSIELRSEDGTSALLAPNILINSIMPRRCCKQILRHREVSLLLDPTTYSYYCSGGGELVYKFYDESNPCAAPHTFTSNLLNPIFCLPAKKRYTLFVCNNLTGCDLDCTGGSLSIPSGVPSSSPMYSFVLHSCYFVGD